MKNTVVEIAVTFGFLAPTVEIFLGLYLGFPFDSLPTKLHIIAFYLIPISLIIVDIQLSKEESNKRITQISLTYCTTVSLIYTIWFLPIIIISALTIISGGGLYDGLNPTPLLFSITSIFLYIASIFLYNEWLEKEGKESIVRWRVAIPACIIILFWNPIMLQICENLLHDDNSPKTKYFSLSLLENIVLKDELRKRCLDYYNSSSFYVFPGFIRYSEQLRYAYYFIYEQHPCDTIILTRSRRLPWLRSRTFDDFQGGDIVGSKLLRLSLKDSVINISSNFTGNHSYYEWTMIFYNAQIGYLEARGVIQLPPNSVVSKVSLWIDGKEKCAAFGTTEKVKTAYKEVIQERREPLLVTMIGQDLVQVQCFPVPSKRTTKIKIGITAPLFERNIVKLPCFVETNFNIPEKFSHSVWIESNTPLKYNEEEKLNHKVKISDNMLRDPATYFYFDKVPPETYKYTDTLIFSYKKLPSIINQKVILLIDAKSNILKRLKDLRWDEDNFEEVIISFPYDCKIWQHKGDLNNFINSQSGFSGVNPTIGLNRALDIAKIKNIPIVWLHGDLPQEFKNTLRGESILRRSEDKFKIVALQLSEGINTIIDDVDFIPYIHKVPRIGDIRKDIYNAIKMARMNNVKDGLFLGGRYDSQILINGSTSKITHPYRLYLYSKVMQQWYTTRNVPEELIDKARQTKIVTPVTGVVGLDTNQNMKMRN